MPDVDVLDKANGHHEEPDVLSPVDDTLSPHPVSTSDAAGESTDETAPPAEHVEEEIKEEPPAEKGPSKTTSAKPPATAAKKARVTALAVDDSSRNRPKLTFHSIHLPPLDASGPVIVLLLFRVARLSVLASLLFLRSTLQVSNHLPPLRP